MINKELTDRLETILGCLIGSHTSNTTGEDQLEDLITKLKAKDNEVLDIVVESQKQYCMQGGTCDYLCTEGCEKNLM